MRIVVLVLALVACKKEPEAPDTTLRNAYIDSLCRFYVPGDCADNASATCGGAITFDTIDDCATFLKFGLSGCSGYIEAINENESTVQGCIDQLDAFDCATGEVCSDTGSDIMTSGDCGAVDALIQPLCPEDTGDTGA